MHEVISDFGECGTWGVSTYSRCEMRCQYCVTGAQGASVPMGSPAYIRDRIIEFVAGPSERRSFAVGPAVDAYPRSEQLHRVTRAALETLHGLGEQIRVITKGLGVRRDVDILSEPGHAVVVSLSTLDVEAARRLEPLAPTPQARMAMAHELADAGVNVEISAAPWIPGVSDAEAILEAADGLEVRFGRLKVDAPMVAPTRFGRHFDQNAINRAFEEEMRRVPAMHPVFARPAEPRQTVGGS